MKTWFCFFQLDEFDAQQNFDRFLEKFAKQNKHDTLIVQCNHKGGNLPHILHAKYLLEQRKSTEKDLHEVAAEAKEKAVCFLYYKIFSGVST